ncbi:IucA/IucC family protein [Shimazuella kribbensis]|uniref:IucA/IucC family protein n=1 Tax=Shimazuella kribbensis TaxID=139808 RepID=UPI000423ED30|nr:IucA/IucC family protein [Shimazuella kribbensis]
MSKIIAEQTTMANFMNCYLREIKNYAKLEKDKSQNHPLYWLFSVCQTDILVVCPQLHQGIDIIVPVSYWSPTGRHLFQYPWHYFTPTTELLPLDLVTLITVITKELSITNNRNGSLENIVSGVIQSSQHTAYYISKRKSDFNELYSSAFRFIEAEQSLIFGHPMHPTPKSREGLSAIEKHIYSPEEKGKFPLHFFRVHLSIIKETSSLEMTTTQLLKEEFLHDEELGEEFKNLYLKDDGYAILPIHPLQANLLLSSPTVNEWIDQKLLENLGTHGRAYYPTSSIRTMYHPQARFMLKGSLPIKITNSVRVNKLKELERGVEISKLLQTKLGEELNRKYPTFQIIKDPAFITIQSPNTKEESGFELILRENPFPESKDANISLIAGLGQDSINGGKNRLSTIIHEIAQREQRSTADISLEWFKKYLSISFEPIMWLYHQHGIALEAHQQNSLVALENGYPHRFYYRDNQGYYYCESTISHLQKILPSINEKSQTMCPDHVADERLLYYLFINHLFGLIQAFGNSELIEEKKLLALLRNALFDLPPAPQTNSKLTQFLLKEAQLPCKANLLTRLYDMDELVGPLESQSIYVQLDNPLIKGVKIDHGESSSSHGFQPI